MDTLAQLLGSDELQVQMKEEISETLTQDNFNIIFVYNNFIDYVNKYVCCLTGSWSPLMGDAVLHAGWRQGRSTKNMIKGTTHTPLDKI